MRTPHTLPTILHQFTNTTSKYNSKILFFRTHNRAHQQRGILHLPQYYISSLSLPNLFTHYKQSSSQHTLLSNNHNNWLHMHCPSSNPQNYLEYLFSNNLKTNTFKSETNHFILSYSRFITKETQNKPSKHPKPWITPFRLTTESSTHNLRIYPLQYHPMNSFQRITHSIQQSNYTSNQPANTPYIQITCANTDSLY